MTKLEQLKLQKAMVEGRLRILERQLAELEKAIRRVAGSIEEHETISASMSGAGIRPMLLEPHRRRMVGG